MSIRKILSIGVLLLLLAGCLLMACGSSEDFTDDYSTSDLYAIVIPEGAQPTGITPGDYVLTLDNIIADLGATHIVNQNGKVEGIPDEQQQQGMQRMYQI